MSNLVIIKPKPKSRSFTNVNGTMNRVVEELTDGNIKEKTLGTYNGEKFPGSKQIERAVIWSDSKKKWLIKGITSNGEELNDIVKKCNLQYPERHPQAGHYISTADLFNSKDPFFCHDDLRINLTEGETVLKLDTPLHYLAYLGFQENHKFQLSGDKINPAVSGRAKYIITDRNIDIQSKKETRNKKQDAIKLYDELCKNYEKLRSVAIGMGLIKDENTTQALIEEILWEAIEDDKHIYFDKMTKLEYFLKIAKAPSDELNLRNLMEKAINGGHIKLVRNSGYNIFGVFAGKTKTNLLEYMKNPQNSDILNRLQSAIENND